MKFILLILVASLAATIARPESARDKREATDVQKSEVSGEEIKAATAQSDNDYTHIRIRRQRPFYGKGKKKEKKNGKKKNNRPQTNRPTNSRPQRPPQGNNGYGQGNYGYNGNSNGQGNYGYNGNSNGSPSYGYNNGGRPGYTYGR
ncbi:anti-sigma-I factor RsgI-like [Artemia franciscana]|uniref:anti-sigma-I factor RsgI-like n=1 Tax=Artemia franciscana TaxID=6661 RepID=UPI0032D9D768